jgi:hypothetical protein
LLEQTLRSKCSFLKESSEDGHICRNIMLILHVNIQRHLGLEDLLTDDAPDGMVAGPNVIKHFTAVIYEFLQKVRLFVPGKPFQSSLLFVVKLEPTLLKSLSGPYSRVSS